MEFFGPATRHWFSRAFERPTPVQERGWERIHAGDHTLLIAPTGSGKTLAAFLYALDRLIHSPPGGDRGVRVVYVSPLKALVYDIERNLRTPLAGIQRAAGLAADQLQLPIVSVRTGDTTARERRQQLRQPGDILVTTPESLYLLLGSAARETLRTVQWVIVDEIHAMAATKRGAHLALSLERLSALADRDPQRIGLSATAKPAEEVARFLGGDRPVSVVDAHVAPQLDLQVVVPVEDMTRPGDTVMSSARPSGSLMLAEEDETVRQYGIWPAVYPRLLELILAHRTTLVFANSRGLCERLAQQLNEASRGGGDSASERGRPEAARPVPPPEGGDLVRAHHGSLAHEQRREIEEQLKAGTLRALIATSSLELGIDMGAVDLVILVESPASVASGLQRVGRAGHQVGETSIGRVFPKHRGDLLEAAVVAQRMREGAIEPLRVPQNPLDVLAQHIVAMSGAQEWRVADLTRVVRRAANFSTLPDSALVAVLDMLSGLYPSHDFAELRPRIRWDRERDTIVARPGARMLAAVNAGTIPDRGLYGVYLGVDGPRVGELDEEMVHESQAGQTFTLGATTWRIQEITRDRVIVDPAPGESGRLPFWKGEGPGRPLELGRALGEFTRTIASLPPETARGTLQAEFGLDTRAARNLVAYLEEQREATGTVPSDRDVVIERFRDELGDWRICLLTPFGARVHAPWALALRSLVSERVGYDVQTVWSDDGIVLTIADGDEPPDIALLVPDPDDIEERILAELARAPLFASQFRENAARALLLPRRRPGQRTPLFAQRLRAQKLMAVALQFPGFPIVMETYRSCLQDVFDVPALRVLLQAIAAREVRLHDVETSGASPFARSLVFAYVAAYLYEGDSPAAERRAQALSLDMKLLRELLGETDLRQLLDEQVIEAVEQALQRLSAGRRARHPDELHDLLRQLGELSTNEVQARTEQDPAPWLELLRQQRRAFLIRIGGRDAWLAVEDVALYRDALGTSPPPGVPAAFLGPEPEPVESLLLRYARTHGPFTTRALAERYALSPEQVRVLLDRLVQQERLLHGEFRPGATEAEWCDPDVLRQIKRRTIARLRGQVAPVPRATLARFLPAWHAVLPGERTDQLLEVIARLEGMPLSYQDLVRMILPARVRDFRPQQLDELGALGLLVWVGHSPLRSDDGRIMLFRRERVHQLLLPASRDDVPLELDHRHHTILDRLADRGASFLGELRSLLSAESDETVLTAVWDLVWAGLITNDTLAALHTLASPRRARRTRAPRHRPGSGGAFSRSLGASALRPAASFVGGRWSLVRDLVTQPVSTTERAHSWGATLLERHGIVVRETAALEALGGGFGAVYRVLRSMEESGRLRRGYFIEGLGGAQFAYPGTVDRLRRVRDLDDQGDVVALAASDPANPYGWLLPWPPLTVEGAHGARRAVGAVTVLVAGDPVLFLDQAGRRLRTFADVQAEQIARALPALREVARGRARGSLTLHRVDHHSAIRSPLMPMLERAGFRQDYRFLRIDA